VAPASNESALGAVCIDCGVQKFTLMGRPDHPITRALPGAR